MHSVETHSIVISETIDFEVTLHFSVGTHRDSNEPPLHVAFISGFIQGVCGTSLAVDGVWRGTHGGLWYPLREDARFEARVHPRHLQTFTATHIFLHAYYAACSTHRNTHIRPEGVAWAAMSYAGPRTSPPLRRQWGLWDPERHRTSKPGGRGAGLAFGPIFGSDPNHHHFPLHATAYCQHVPRPTSLVSIADNGYAYLVHHVRPGWIRRLCETSSITRGHVSSARSDHR